MQQKTSFQNRDDKRIVVLVEYPEGETKTQQHLAFVMHGLGGFKEQPHIEIMRDCFLKNGFVVVSFDATHTFGESEGDYEDATVTNYLADLEDVIEWAKNQEWYKEPFFLAGHSLGAMAVALFAEDNPNLVEGLAPIATVVSGKLSLDAHTKEYYENWKKVGYVEKASISKPGTVKKLKWLHMEDRLKYDLLSRVDRLKMPTILIVGTEDESTPPKHQKILFDALPGEKEYHEIEGSNHSFRSEEFLRQLRNILFEWIKKQIA